MKRYLKIWKQLAAMSFEHFFTNRIDSFNYFLGKIFRFLFFLIAIFGIFRFTDNLAGYSKYQAILFYLTFNLVDVLSQVAFRGLYSLGPDVRRGMFDYTLSKPANKLFLILTSKVDFLDVVFLVPIVAVLVFSLLQVAGGIAIAQLLKYFSLLILGLIIVTGIHILVAANTVMKVENEAALWLYRDSISIGRFPPDILPSSVQYFFTLVIPIIIIAAFPVKALLGALSWPWLLFAFVYAIGFFWLSLVIWERSLKKYSSASS